MQNLETEYRSLGCVSLKGRSGRECFCAPPGIVRGRSSVFQRCLPATGCVIGAAHSGRRPTRPKSPAACLAWRFLISILYDELKENYMYDSHGHELGNKPTKIIRQHKGMANERVSMAARLLPNVRPLALWTAAHPKIRRRVIVKHDRSRTTVSPSHAAAVCWRRTRCLQSQQARRGSPGLTVYLPPPALLTATTLSATCPRGRALWCAAAPPARPTAAPPPLRAGPGRRASPPSCWRT